MEIGAPTARLQVEVYASRNGQGFWRSAGPAFPDADDYINSETQLTRALVTYGTMTARLLFGSPATAFRVLVRSLSSEALIGHCEWRASPDSGRFIPASEPWTHWEPAEAVAA